MQAKKTKPNASELGGKEEKKVFYNDDLTTRTRKLLIEAKCLRSQYYVWPKNGQVMCRSRSEDDKGTRIINYMKEINDIRKNMKKATVIMQNNSIGTKHTINGRSPTDHEEMNRNRKKKGNQNHKLNLGKFRFNKNEKGRA